MTYKIDDGFTLEHALKDRRRLIALHQALDWAHGKARQLESEDVDMNATGEINDAMIEVSFALQEINEAISAYEQETV